MSKADGSSAAESIVLPDGHGWRKSILAFAIVLAPMALAIVVMAVGLAARAAWIAMLGVSVEPATSASIRLYGLLSYAVGSWLAVALAWFWTKRRKLGRDVFVFRRLTLPAFAAGAFGFTIVAVSVPIVTHWLTGVTGGQSPNLRLDFHDAHSVAIVVFLFVVTTPVTEEILYRGLLVAWLRRLGWKDLNILVLGSLIFSANHIIPLGFVWGVAMILLGVVTYALRLRYESLSLRLGSPMHFSTRNLLSYIH